MKKTFPDISHQRRIRTLPEDQGVSESSVKATIRYAISHNFKIDIFYADDMAGGTVLRGYRSVSPVALGSHASTGNGVFRAYLNSGVSKSEHQPRWRLFRTDRVQSIKMYMVPQRARFDSLYRPNDKHIGNMTKQAYRRKDATKRRRKVAKKRKRNNS